MVGLDLLIVFFHWKLAVVYSMATWTQEAKQ